MHKFYFNECFSQTAVTLNNFVDLLIKTIIEYESLIKKDLGVERNVILEKETEKTIVCGGYLKQAILSIPDKDREIRSLAYSYFTKAPIQLYLKSDERLDNEILEQEYKFETHDATNLVIAQYNSCFLFSVGVDNTIKKNILTLKGSSVVLTIDNLYGGKQNTEYIGSQLIKSNSSSLELFERLKMILGNTFYKTSFEKEFRALPETIQETIISLFERAKERHLKTPYAPDTNLIKDVTPEENKKKVKVYELREKSEGIRLYFYEQEDIIYLASIAFKKDYKDNSGSAQSRDKESFKCY